MTLIGGDDESIDAPTAAGYHPRYRSGGQVHSEDNLHPARHLRAALGRAQQQTGPHFTTTARAAPPPSPIEQAVQRPRRGWAWIGALLSLALVPAVVAVPGLLERSQPSPATSGTAAPASPQAAVGPSGEVYPTIAMSTAAISAAPAGQTIGNIRMFGEDAGWAQRLAEGTILHTIHGPQGWTTATPPTSGRVLAAAYLDARSAIALTVPQDTAGAIVIQTWSTDDGGTTWERRGTFLVGVLTHLAEGMVFSDARDGWVSIDEAASGFHGMVVYHTTDGGAHWAEMARTTNG
jgi:hypothetical protein